jgi:UDP-N-acetylmuramate dehydrogenase
MRKLSKLQQAAAFSDMTSEFTVRENVSLAPLCSLQLGGCARYFVAANESSTVIEALNWAERRNVPVAILGGGTNVVVADQGFDGLVIAILSKGVTVNRQQSTAKITAMAGEKWDSIVELAVQENLAGIECLSGIPGLAGSTVVQNVGAYGQEVSQVITEVTVLDRKTREEKRLRPVECRFDYRDSSFKQHPQSYVILSVSIELRPDGIPTLNYPELERHLGVQRGAPTLPQVREAVQNLRRAKSMLCEQNDENCRSVGSFFCNPIITRKEAQQVTRLAIESEVARTEKEIPQFPVDGNRVKFAAAWLIEAAGFGKGYRMGNVGISSRHALALVHHGNGSTSEIIELAKKIRSTVKSRFGILLEPEPTFLGFARNPLSEKYR